MNNENQPPSAWVDLDSVSMPSSLRSLLEKENDINDIDKE